MLVNPRAAPTMPASPSQVMRAAPADGNLRRWPAATATSAPSASSQARVKGEKYATVGAEDVWTTDHVSDAATAAMRNTLSLARNDIRRPIVATTRKMVG